MTTPNRSASGVIRAVVTLSAGTFVVQALSAVAQMLLAIWLSPSEFGYWAAATSILAVLTGLVNLGEVNGYLSTPSASYRRASRSSFMVNMSLLGSGALVGVAYLVYDNYVLAVLLILCAINLPLLGEANLLYAYCVKYNQRGRLIRAQVISAIARLCVGVLVAWLTGSALAFAISTLAYSAILILALRPKLAPDPAGSVAVRVPRSRRFAWASLSVAQMLTRQIDYLVVWIVSTPTLLGTYFFSYQVSIGLSAVVSGPLSKSALNELAREAPARRRRLANELIAYVTGGVGIACAAAALVVLAFGNLLPEQWRGAAPVIIVLLGSLPARFVTPITDAVQMADGRWWRSTALSGLDSLGTALAALVALTGRELWLAAAIVAWKVLFALVRYFVALPGASLLARGAIVAYVLTFSSCLVLAGLASDRSGLGFAGAIMALAVGGVALLGSAAIRRRRTVKGQRQ